MKLKKFLLLAILMLSVDLCAQTPPQTTITFDAKTKTDKGENSSRGNSDILYKDGIKITSTYGAFALTSSYPNYSFFPYSDVYITSTIGYLKKIIFTCSTKIKKGSPQGFTTTWKPDNSGTYKIGTNPYEGIWSSKYDINKLLIKNVMGDVYATKIEVTVDKYPNTTTISSAGYATYCCDKAVDYTKTYGLVAYKAKYDSEKKMIVLTKVGKVPANTPVVLKGEGGLYGFPTLESAPKAVTDNDLKVATTDMTCTNNMWILVKKSTGVGFAPATPGTTLAKGKCYLVIESDASSKFLPFDETTGISHISPNAVRSDGKTYNILGQEVGNDYKGIVILDGKKVVRK